MAFACFRYCAFPGFVKNVILVMFVIVIGKLKSGAYKFSNLKTVDYKAVA